MLTDIVQALKQNRKKIVFTEGEDPRILEASQRLVAEGLMDVLLCGDSEKIKAAAAAGGFNLDGIEIMDPATYSGFEEMVEEMVALRKGKMTAEDCRACLQKSNYFGTMLVKLGKADGLLGGATYSTADTVRPALQIIKTKPGTRLVSSCMIMFRKTENGSEKYAMGDCAINLSPNADELADIALSTAETARLFGIEPKVAMLSYSSKGSGKGEAADLVRSATEKALALKPDLDLDGELQFDAAFSPAVAAQKAKGSKVAGQANVFIFPDISSGNIGYKIAQRLGGFAAYGPILQGLNAPINDLSRGCNAEEVYSLAIITLGTALL